MKNIKNFDEFLNESSVNIISDDDDIVKINALDLQNLIKEFINDKQDYHPIIVFSMNNEKTLAVIQKVAKLEVINLANTDIKSSHQKPVILTGIDDAFKQKDKAASLMNMLLSNNGTGSSKMPAIIIANNKTDLPTYMTNKLHSFYYNGK